MKAMIDSLFGSGGTRKSYRRLLAFVTCTGLLLADKLDGDQWVYVCMAFILGEAAPAAMKALKA